MKSARSFGVATLIAVAATTFGHAATITVTGGNAADVVNALNTSNPGDIIQIGDNLTYDFTSHIGSGPVAVASRTLRAAPGFQPTITADPPSSPVVPTIFRLTGDATNTGAIEGLRFVAGSGAQLVRYIHVFFTKNVTIRANEFTLQNLERNFLSGRAVELEGSTTFGPTILIERNLFHTTAASSFNGQSAIRTDGGVGGFIVRNNIMDMTGRSSGDAFGLFLNNEGSQSGTTIINNTLLFNTLANGIGVNLGTPNQMNNGFIQNNIFLNADLVYRDQNTSGGSTLTISYNLFDNVGAVFSAQPADTITTNNNLSGIGIALLNGEYRPQTGTLALNNGLNGLNYGPIDFYGDQRVRGAAVDIGAVEIPEPAGIGLLSLTLLLIWRRWQA